MNKRDSIRRVKRRRQNLLIVSLFFLITIAVAGRLIFGHRQTMSLKDLDLQTITTSRYENIRESEIVTKAYFPVHIAGSVNNPGVYYFTEGAIVKDAIEGAGGFSNNAVVDYLNMAALLSPNIKLYVPSLEEIEEGYINAFEQNAANGNSAASNSVKINLNQATSEELISVPGIGPATAAAIIEYREINGAFEKLEDLMLVAGIKEKKYAKIETYLYVP